MRFLICGLGSIGNRHLQNLEQLGEKDIILYRTYKSTLPEKDEDKYPIETNLQRALDYKPDAVIISNPTALHLDVAIPAAKNGCHLLIEKPISNSMQRIDELHSIIQKNTCRVLVAFQFRFHPSLKYIRTNLAKGILGKIYYVHAHWGEYLPNWHPWEDYRHSYSARKELGGGVLLTLCHPVDYLSWIIGKIESIQGFLGNSSKLEMDVEDHAEVLLRFRNGIAGSMHLDFYQQPTQHTLEFIGANGTMKWDNKDGIVYISKGGDNWKKVFEPVPGFNRNDLFLEEMHHFINVVKGEEKPICPIEDGLFVQKVLDSIKRSNKSGERMYLK